MWQQLKVTLVTFEKWEQKVFKLSGTRLGLYFFIESTTNSIFKFFRWGIMVSCGCLGVGCNF